MSWCSRRSLGCEEFLPLRASSSQSDIAISQQPPVPVVSGLHTAAGEHDCLLLIPPVFGIS